LLKITEVENIKRLKSLIVIISNPGINRPCTLIPISQQNYMVLSNCCGHNICVTTSISSKGIDALSQKLHNPEKTYCTNENCLPSWCRVLIMMAIAQLKN
jgi:hypothetical protein